MTPRILAIQADITTLQVDAIVNAANSMLLGGGGVDGAIHEAAGPELLAECRTLDGCPPGKARLTKGYALPAGHVIHTVGPIWDGGEDGEPEILESAYRSSMEVAELAGFRSIAFPCISTGIFGFPPDQAAEIACATVRAELAKGTSPLETVIFCCFSEADRQRYERILRAPPAARSTSI